MSSYGGTGSATLIRENQQVFLFQQEQVEAGEASLAVQLERLRGMSYPWGVSFEIAFTDVNGNPSTPGAFEIDIQTSDRDTNNSYVKISALNSTASLNSTFVGRIELPTFWAKYVRAYVASITNPVYVTVLCTR